jgi:hypothetical protein
MSTVIPFLDDEVVTQRAGTGGQVGVKIESLRKRQLSRYAEQVGVKSILWTSLGVGRSERPVYASPKAGDDANEHHLSGRQRDCALGGHGC